MRSLIHVIVPLLLAPAAVSADDAGLQRCRAVADPTARLACYDALGSAPVSAVQAQRFGLSAPAVETLQAVDSHIPGRFDGWEPKTRIRLANGQVWEIADGSRGALAPVVDPKVRVRRGAVGSFYLEIEGLNRSPRIKRID